MKDRKTMDKGYQGVIRSVLSVLHWFTPSYYPLVSFVHCFVCPSVIYVFLLPLGIFCPLLFLSLIDICLLITAWYLLYYVLSVLHGITSSYYPLVSFVHCFVRLSLIYAFLLPDRKNNGQKIPWGNKKA
jgi:hypothetical protein